MLRLALSSPVRVRICITYTDCSVGPTQTIDTDAFALVFAIPRRPIVADRLALEDSDDDERRSKGAGESNGGPYHSFHFSRWEDSLVKKQERQFQQRKVEEVQNLHDVKNSYEVGDCVERKSPGIHAKPGPERASINDDSVGNTKQEGDDNEVVVPAEFSSRDSHLVSYPDEYKQRRDDSKNDADSSTK